MDFWHGIQDFAHKPTSLDIPGQTNLDEINLLEALTHQGEKHSVVAPTACEEVEEEPEEPVDVSQRIFGSHGMSNH